VENGGPGSLSLALATCWLLLHFAKDERAYIASERFLSPGDGLSPFHGGEGYDGAYRPGHSALVPSHPVLGRVPIR
jgi:hypothetical protein